MVVIKYKNSCLSIVLLLSGCSASRVDNDKGLGIDPDSFPAKHSAVTALNPLLREDMATSQIDMYKSKVEADLQASLDKLSCPEKHLQVSLNRVYKFIEEYREIVDNITNVVKDPIHGVEGIDAAVTSYIERLLRMMDKMKREIYESAKTWEIREERFELYRMFMQITSGVCSNKTRKIYESIDSGITEPTNRKTILHAISNVLVSSKSLAELCLQQFEKSGGKLQDVFYIKPLSIDLQIDVMITSCNGQLPSQSSRDVANESVVDEHKGDASVKSDVSYDLATQAALTAKSITDEMIAKIAAAKAKKSGLKSLVDEIYDELTNMLADKGRAMLKELVSSADDSKVRVLQASFTSEEAFEDISKEPATFVSTAFLPNISQVPLHDENPESMAALEVAPEKGTPEEILIRFSCIDNLVIKCIKKFSQDLLAYERWVRYVLLIIENSGSTKFGIDRNVAFFLEEVYIIMNNISVEIFESIVNAIEKGDDRQYINIYIQAVNAVNSHEMKNLYEKIKIGITDKQTKGKICKCINELFKSTMYLAYASIMLFNESGCKISDIFSRNIFNTDIKDESIKNSCGEDNVDKDNGKGEKTDEEPKNVTKVKKDESIGEGTSTVDEPKKTPGNEIVTEDKKDESIEEGTGTDDEPKSAPDIEIVTEDIKDESTVEGTGTDDAPISASSGASVTERKKDESKVEGTGNDDVISKIAAYSKDLTSKLVAKILDAKNKGIDSTVLVDDIFEEMTVVLASKGKAELVELLKGMIEFAADDYATEVDVKGSNE